MSSMGSHIAYHFLIGKDGTVKQNRPLIARTGHTRNQEVNLASIAIVLAGDFDKEDPTPAQLSALREKVAELDSIYRFEQIIPHREASSTACPGERLLAALKDVWREPKRATVGEGEIWNISRYYTPVPGQTRYYRKTYEEDFAVNCQGDCFKTADGFDLHDAKPMTVAACPPEFKLGTRLHIEGIGEVTCHDRGGAIKGKRLDIWAGYGDAALDRIRDPSNRAGPLKVRVL